MDGDGVAESSVVLSVLQTWPPKIQNRVINNSTSSPIFNWLNAGPGGFRSRAPIAGESRWDWQTAQTVYSFSGSSCRNDMCTFNEDLSTLAGAFNVPGRTVVQGNVTSSNASLTSSLIQSFSPGKTLLSCTSSVEQVINGNFAYTITCQNDTEDTIQFEVPPDPLGCCTGTDEFGNPNQIRCDLDVVVTEDNPATPEDESVTATESTCVDYLSDLNNCGGCGVVCGDDQVCDGGSCENICDGDDEWCGEPNEPDSGECSDLQDDPSNCGACGETCGSVNSVLGMVDEVCVAGECELCDLDSRTRCGNDCADLESDPLNCGECGRDCNAECGGSGTCGEGECICTGTAPLSASADADRFGESKLEFGGSRRQPGATRRSAQPKAGPIDIPPPAPLCETEGEILTVATGDVVSECVASPFLPIEVTGSLIACGTLIPEGSPLCGGNVGTAGIFQRLEPGTGLPQAIDLSMIGIQVNDGVNGNGLIEAGESVCMTVKVANAGTDTLANIQATLSSDAVDLDCGQIFGSACVPDDSDPVALTIHSGVSGYADLRGVAVSDPGNTSCFDDDGNRLPPVLPESRAINEIEFCVDIPATHPTDVVRPFELQFEGTDPSGAPVVIDVPFSLGIASPCDLGPGGFPDSLELGPPFAPLVPVEDPLLFADETVTSGDPVPISIGMSCGGAPIGETDIAYGPRILSLIGENVGDITPADGGFVYDPSSGEWILTLDTSTLPPDTYVMTLRVNDTKDYHTGFTLCGDADGDGFNDCTDNCPNDAGKVDGGICGCGFSDVDSDSDGTADCIDECADDSGKIVPGICGCGVSDADSDADGVADCNDACAEDGDKVDPGVCGCGFSDVDSDADGVADCNDACASDGNKIDPGVCGCGVSDADTDGDGIEDCNDACAEDGDKDDPGICGCGFADTDTDADGTPDCNDPCGDGQLGIDEECDDGNAIDGDGCNAQCLFEAECDLSVAKTCFVVENGDDDDDDDCAGHVTGLKLEYTGAGCEALTNLQGGKARCEGAIDGAEPTNVMVYSDRGRVYADEPVVLLGDIIEATAANAGVDKFSSTTEVAIDDGAESILFHTSCSKPLHVGDQFGSVRLVELTSTRNGTVTLPDPDPSLTDGEQTCYLPQLPPEPHCEGKVQMLGMRYLGGTCGASTGEQEDKFSCSGDVGVAEPVRIVCSKDGSGPEQYLDSGSPASVYFGDVVELSAASGGRNELRSQTTCTIYDEFGAWLQEISMHTSCSRPINLEETFGALQVVSMDTTRGGPISTMNEVVYTYKVTNNSPLPATDVSVVDDKLGVVPGSPIPVLAPGETVVLKTLTLIDEETVNTVIVEGSLDDGRECPPATDQAYAMYEEPEQECSAPIDSLLLQYVGPDVVGPVTVEVVPRRGGSSPAMHYFEGGLSAGMVIASPTENDFTIAAGVRDEEDLGSRTTLSVNGLAETLHTSCSVPVVAGQPAPLDDPKGAPSSNWIVVGFVER